MPENGSNNPHEEVDDSHNGEEEEPEPEKSENLLVEQVDRQGTLKRPWLYIVQLTQLKVAQGHLKFMWEISLIKLSFYWGEIRCRLEGNP